MGLYDFAVLGSGPDVDDLLYWGDAVILAEISAKTEPHVLYYPDIQDCTYSLALVDGQDFNRRIKEQVHTLRNPFTGFSPLCGFRVSTIQTTIQKFLKNNKISIAAILKNVFGNQYYNAESNNFTAAIGLTRNRTYGADNQLRIAQSLVDYGPPYLIIIDVATPDQVSPEAIKKLSKAYNFLPFNPNQ